MIFLHNRFFYLSYKKYQKKNYQKINSYDYYYILYFIWTYFDIKYKISQKTIFFLIIDSSYYYVYIKILEQLSKN